MRKRGGREDERGRKAIEDVLGEVKGIVGWAEHKEAKKGKKEKKEEDNEVKARMAG